MKYFLVSYTLCLIALIPLQAQTNQADLNKIEFEKQISENVSVAKGKISLSSAHRVSGETSLRWDFVPGDALTIKGGIAYKPQEILYTTNLYGVKYPVLSDPVHFNLPFYSEKQQPTTLRVQFGTDEDVNCFIDIRLDYQGWKKFNIPYDRGHMRGKPKEGMNFMRIELLGDAVGTVFLDDLIFAERLNARFLKASPLVPTLKQHPQRVGPVGSTTVQTWHLERPWFPLQSDVSQAQREAFRTIEDRLYELEWGGRRKDAVLNSSRMEDLKERFDYFYITRNKNNINGRHLDSRSDRTKLNKLLKEVGILYQSCSDSDQKEKLAAMGLDLIEHAIDVDNTINWYDGRGFADGCYLLKEELRKVGLLNKTIAFLKEKYAFPRFYNEDVLNGRHGSPSFSSDEIYTNSIGFIVCILMQDESPEKVRDMQHFISFYSNVAFNYSNGITDTFKPDGSHYHHANAALTRYGAYTMPMACEVVRIFSKTAFRISEEAHQRMKHNVLVRRFYRTKNYFPYAFSHNRIRPLDFQIFDDSRHLAFSGTPDGSQEIDKDMAAVYLRMMDGDDLPKECAVFKELNVQAETSPQGHHTLSYFAKGIHRKDDWMAVVGAHSRYIYQKENWSWHATRGSVKYGMFENWGSLELIYPDKPGLPQVDNGRTLEGWDWTKIPGVTSIEAPLDRIQIQTLVKGDDRDEEHLRSDQPFVGGLDAADGNGIFVMKFRGHHKYDFESFYATKSWFFFGDLIICLGSDIRNDLPEYSTHTCLFQNSFDVTDFALSCNQLKPLKDKPFELQVDGNDDNYLVDSRKVGYYIPSQQPFKLSYGLQKSRDYQDRKDTEANIEKAWLLHGNAPDGASYEYAVKMRTTTKQMKDFAKQQKDHKIYELLQADKEAHIVKHIESNTTAAIAFDTNYDLNAGLLSGVSHSGLVMLRENEGKLNLVVSDPDLRFYEGFNSDIVDLQLNRREEPSYSNYWHGHESIPSTIKVFLKGDWNLSKLLKGNGKVIQRGNGMTVVEFTCQHGLSNEVVLEARN